MKQSCKLASVCFSAALLAACGGTVTNSPSVPPGTQAQNQTWTGPPTFVYVTNIASKTISAYEIDRANGALTPVRRSPFGTREYPWGVAVVPGKFVYVANGVGTNMYSRRHSYVTAYGIKTDGVLTRLAGSPFADAGKGAADMAVSVSHKFAYVVNIYSDNVSYAIDATSGALTPVMGSPFGTGGEPETLAIDPKGRFVYVPNTLSNDVSAFKINASTGALRSVAGSPFPAGTTPAGAAVDRTGKFLYVTNANSNNVSAFKIDATSGALTRWRDHHLALQLPPA